MSDVLRFIRKNGRIIPIRAAGQAHRAGKTALGVGKAGVLGGSAYAANRARTRKKTLAERVAPIKVNKKFDAIGLGLSVASGALGAATFHHGFKGLIAGQIAGHAMDAVGIAANVRSVAGRGRTKARIEQGTKQEARNFLVGNAVFYAGILAQKKTRVDAVKVVAKVGRAAGWIKKFIKLNLHE